ncbi:MAG: primosomal protein N' [Solirubrobacteraceae bacterium]|nr:primosomal protein N' [Solirubrobacteraceae bacterium]
MPPVARVLPLVTARGLPGELDYLEESGAAGVGTVVRIPLGGRAVDGIVVARANETDVPAEKLKAVEAVEERSTTSELVDLARWLADDVASTTARALQLVEPPAGKPKQRLWARVALVVPKSAGESDGNDGSGRGMSNAEPPTRGVSVGDPMPESLDALLPEGTKLTPAQRELLEGLLRDGPRPAGDDLARLRTLEKRGLVVIEQTDERRRPSAHAVGASAAKEPPATDEQLAAIRRIDEARESGGGALLLHGVTGSGKTEVYLRATRTALEAGRTVLVLVPEIGLTPQIVHRFQQRFGDVVAVMHSGLAKGERRDEWWRVRSGEARIVVGARSAVFAPLEGLGLVIVDEEHDSSYKHEGDPRYDARRVAAWRAKRAGAVLVCGSATPRPESFAALELVRMTQRVDGRGMPPVEIVDMKGSPGALHARTREALVDCHKAIVLLNRRGWSNFLECRDCGHAFGCPNCDVTLVLHRRRGTLDCHHCGHTEHIPRECPACGSVSIARHGLGTERLEQDLAGLGLEVLRVDADVRDPGAVLARFGELDRAVLVGTQLVAKGHDFPDVDLAVVLDADATLRFPDLRSEERTFALITQLAGRAGRGGTGHGKVLVQTNQPQHPVILAAARHDADGFLAAELQRRREHAYPPYSTMVRLVVAHHDQRVARELARTMAQVVASEEIGEVLGPAPLFKLRGREREQVLVKAQYRGQAVAAVREAVGRVERQAAQKRAQLTVDVAPQ